VAVNVLTLCSFKYQLGQTGNRTNLSEMVNGTSRAYQWQYDNLYRLTNESVGSLGAMAYAYDPVGNRTNRLSSGSQMPSLLPSASYSYGTNDWLTTDTYDPNGNTIVSSGTNFHYDVMNHITNAIVNGSAILMTYDGDGNRVSKMVGGVTTYYLVDDANPSGYSQVLEEWTNNGTTGLSKVYNYGLSLISQRTPNVSTNYFISDGLGSTRMLTDIGGTVVNVLVYDAYGNLIASNGLLQTAYLYSGQQYDFDLGLYLNRARYLDTRVGRFWTMDTFEGDDEDPLSLQKYLYAAGNPVNMGDPGGNDYGSFSISTIAIGGILAQNLPSITYEHGLGSFTVPTVFMKYYTGMFTLQNAATWPPDIAGTWGQPCTHADGNVIRNGRSEMTTSVWVWGDTCNTSVVPGEEGQMYLPNGETVHGSCGSIQATIYGQPNQSYRCILEYKVGLVNGASFKLWGPNPKDPPWVSAQAPYGKSPTPHGEPIPVSGNLDSYGRATITYVPSLHTTASGGITQATGDLKIEDLKQ